MSSFVLPNFPHTTSWLSDEERAYAVWRIAKDIGDLDCAEDEPSMVQSAWLAIKDYRTWMFVAIQHCILLAQTVTFFFPSIVSTLGYDNYTSKWPRRLGKASTSLDSLYYILAQITHAFSALLLTCPVWVATFIACLFTSFSTSRLKERTMHIVVPMAFTIVGYIMCITITVRGARFFAMFLMAMGAQCCFMVVLTWISNSFPRPLGKRAAVIAIVNMVGNASNIYGSYLYPSSSAPMYVFGGATVGMFIFILIFWLPFAPITTMLMMLIIGEKSWSRMCVHHNVGCHAIYSNAGEQEDPGSWAEARHRPAAVGKSL